MGIPRFYRSMSERYPLLNQPISDVSLLPEFDAFYLDMNGIVHNCTHSDGDPALSALGLAAQLHKIFAYLDRLVTHIIKPKALLYIAIDGVAPRAKLNQQRSRRFRAGLERQEAMAKERFLQIQLEDEKNGAASAAAHPAHFDSNCITPGTEFLAHLSRHLVYFVRQKMALDPLWARLEVFFSGSEVPGEGEHKIVEFIRHRKMAAGYPPNVRHCMYGSDADLMLLGLMTHEPHFTLVREVVVWGSGRRHSVPAKPIAEQQWQLVHLSLFREYLLLELRATPALDGERMLDDFLLLTFLLGNDFIPHSPTLEISEDAIPLLLREYRALLEQHGGQYLTENGRLVNVALLQALLNAVGSKEEDILTTRQAEEASRRKGKQHPSGGRKPPAAVVTHDVSEAHVQTALLALHADDSDDDDRRAAGQAAAADQLPPPLLDDGFGDDSEDSATEAALLEALDGALETTLALAAEKAEHRLFAELAGSKSFQDTKWEYYARKFGVARGDGNAHNAALDEIKRHYVEALVWCLAYYFQGPPSWSWYYPYHYAPMVSDLTNIADVVAAVAFQDDPGTDGPLLPFEQLMANLPASSGHLVPAPYRFLMVSPLSPIKHFYPETFAIDMEGKRNAWEGVNLLPFIDAALLKRAIAQHCPDDLLTPAERARNTLKRLPLRITHDASVDETLASSLPGVPGFPDVPHCHTRVADYALPPIVGHGGQFQSRLVDGVQLPLAGFPSLYTVPLAGVRIENVRLNCFGMSSRKASLLLSVAPTLTSHDGVAVTDLPSLLAKTVLVNWPNLHEAKVVAVSTLMGEHRRVATRVAFTPYDPAQKAAWAAYAQSEVVKLLAGRGVPGSGGIDLGHHGISALLHVLPLQGMVSNPLTGAVEKKFGHVEALVPFQLAVVNRTLHDARFQETERLPLAQRFPRGAVALITGGEWLGCTAEVTDWDDDANDVKVRVNTIDKEPPFGYVIAEKIADKYFPGYLVAQKLGISTTTLGLLTGNVTVKPGDHDIGLNIRFRKDLLLPGFSRLVNKSAAPNASAYKDLDDERNVWRRGDIVKIVGSGAFDDALQRTAQVSRSSGDAATSNTVWEYSERAVKLMAGYKAAFPGVVSKLDKMPFATSYSGAELFGVQGNEQVDLSVARVKAWIEQQRLGVKEHIPVSSEYMSLNAIRAVEVAGALRATERQKRAAERQASPVEVVVPALHLFRPNPLVNQDLTGGDVALRVTKNPGAPRLGDRIINISGRAIPFGHRGTVVATHVSSKCVEVLFDEKFTGGEPLYGSASLDRGKLVPWSNVICVSTPPTGAVAVDNAHRQYANRNGVPRATDGTVKVASKSKKTEAKDKKESGAKKKSGAGSGGVAPEVAAPRVSSNAGRGAAPPPPPPPSSLPLPPDMEKMETLFHKWAGDAPDGKPAPAPAPAAVAPEPPAEEDIAPSVMAFFSAAEASGAVAPPPPVPQPPVPQAPVLVDLFPHNYGGATSGPIAYGRPHGTTPRLLVPHGPAPPPHPHAFINPYQPPPGASHVLHPNAAPFLPSAPLRGAALEPGISAQEYPTLAAAASVPAKKPSGGGVSSEAGGGDRAPGKKHARERRKQTPKSDKKNGKEHAWVPKTVAEAGKPTPSTSAKPTGPQLLLPAQVLRQQPKQPKQQQQLQTFESGDNRVPRLALRLDDNDFPCGAAYRAIRSPRTSSSSDLKRTFLHSREGPASAESGGNQLPPDLAKRAQRRVSDHKRSELEKKQELEKMRQTKIETEKTKKERASQLRHRRRTEIYALNALMKQVQQAKISAFIEAQRRQQRDRAESGPNDAPTAAPAQFQALMQSIGV
ncbi:hypothetical protein PybrP1_011892 [[Pythium] brassicae (nom. inval.)]|nr:hypothetical protein PybrP1_011892 [[Pythium] brassicae (nom. inval.)]